MHNAFRNVTNKIAFDVEGANDVQCVAHQDSWNSGKSH
jgi:hypothetical protein